MVHRSTVFEVTQAIYILRYSQNYFCRGFPEIPGALSKLYGLLRGLPEALWKNFFLQF